MAHDQLKGNKDRWSLYISSPLMLVGSVPLSPHSVLLSRLWLVSEGEAAFSLSSHTYLLMTRRNLLIPLLQKKKKRERDQKAPCVFFMKNANEINEMLSYIFA